MEKVIEMNIGDMSQRVRLISYYFAKKNALKKKRTSQELFILGIRCILIWGTKLRSSAYGIG